MLFRSWMKGKTLHEAEEIKNTDIVQELSLPPVKIHCSVLAEDAIKAAVHDYEEKAGIHHHEEIGRASCRERV